MVIVSLALIMMINGYSQGLNIPSSNYGISIGNSVRFSGVRFNFIDKNIERINGISFSIWNANNDDEITGSISGLTFGLPMSYGSAYKNGISLALFGTGARNDLKGIHIGGLAAGAGEDMAGINIGGLAVGAGKNMQGISLSGLALGAGENMSGINIGGLATGAGKNMVGLNVGGLAVGAGKDLEGLNIAGLAVGSGGDVKGINIGGLAVGAGNNLYGVNISGLAIGAGNKIEGLNIAGLAVGAPEVNGLNIGLIVGGNVVKGMTIAPLYNTIKSDNERIGYMTGVGISSFNHIKGHQRGLTIGILNIAHHLEGIQIGLINIAKSNKRGLKVLPIFNGPFH